MRQLKILIPVLLIIMIACSNESPKKDIVAKIDKNEKALNEAISGKNLNKTQISSLLRLYDEYHMEFPKDTSGATYLMRGGEIALHYNYYKRAIGFFDAVEINFENSRHYPMAVFMKAFVFDQVNDTASARKYYQKFIRENPDHELVEDAEISIENLGKTLEEILQEFEEEKAQRKEQKEKPKQMDEGF